MKNQAQASKSDNTKSSGYRELFDLEDRVDHAMFTSTALLEAMAALFKASENSDEPLLSDSAVDGLQSLACDLGEGLRSSFAQLRDAARRTSNIVATAA